MNEWDLPGGGASPEDRAHRLQRDAGSAPSDNVTQPEPIIKDLGVTMSGLPSFTFSYVNHSGVLMIRSVVPLRIFFGTSLYYTEPQWLMEAFDLDRNANRTFAMSKINKT